MLGSKWVAFSFVIIAWAAYVAASIVGAQTSTPSNYNISQATLQLLRISVYVPFLLTWLAATAGWLYLEQYIRQLKGPHKQLERQAFTAIAGGVGLLAIGLIASPLTSSLRTLLTSSPDALRWLTIVSNYTSILLALLGFTAIFRGAGRLTKPVFGDSANPDWALLIPIVVFGAFYAGLIYTNPIRQVANVPGQPASYYLSDVAILVTIILPALCSWYLGLLSAMRLERYLYRSSANLPRRGLVNLFNGLLAVLAGSILTQALVAFGGARLVNYGLAVTLLLVYLFLAMQALGYGLVALGARRLARLNQTES